MPNSIPSTWTWFYQYNGALIVCVVGSTYGLSIGRPMLQTGAVQLPNAEVLRFAFPLSTTLLQQLIASIFVLLSGCILFCLQLAQRTWPSAFYKPILPADTRLDGCSGADSTEKVFCQSWDPSGARRIIALAGIIATEHALTSYAFCFAPLEIYIIFRSLVLPISILTSKFAFSNQEILPVAAKAYPSLLLTLGTAVAAYRHDLPWPSDAVRCAFLSSVFGAIWPVFSGTLVPGNNSRHTVGYFERAAGSKGQDSSHSIFTFWRYTCYVSLACVAISLGAVLLSTELQQVSRNFYTDGVLFRWLLLQIQVGFFRSIFFCSALLLIQATCATTANFVIVLAYASQMAVLTFSSLLISQKIGIAACVASGVWFLKSHGQSWDTLLSWIEKPSLPRRNGYSRLFTLRRLIVTALVVASCYTGFQIRATYRTEVRAALFTPPTPVHDGYLGPRAGPDALADLDLLVDECRGPYQKPEKLRDVRMCIDYLATQQDTYFQVPEASEAVSASVPGNVSDDSNCGGPISLYHVWWSGPPSWRTELFIKSYFYTQRLACSRLWIWIDVDYHSEALTDWLEHPSFAKFLSFIETGEIALKEWRLPSRVPISPNIDPLDRARYYAQPGRPNSEGEVFVADSIIRDSLGQEYIQFYEPGGQTQLTFYTVACSDAARLIILHLHGGVYLDIDMLLLRDMRPLLLPGRAFSERWGAHADPTLYNNALVALPANSSMSSYLLTGGTRMGLMYHFMILGRMMVSEGRNEVNSERGLLKLESAFFDPPWPAMDGMASGRCLVPCLTSWSDIFKAHISDDEWSAYDGEMAPVSEHGNNRTMENFFRGAWAYHMHNQWNAVYEQGSWIDVIARSHDRFFTGSGTNAYGEKWSGNTLSQYGTEGQKNKFSSGTQYYLEFYAHRVNIIAFIAALMTVATGGNQNLTASTYHFQCHYQGINFEAVWQDTPLAGSAGIVAAFRTYGVCSTSFALPRASTQARLEDNTRRAGTGCALKSAK
ncbi:hypothetical protein V494_02256 [Pseudogymnoascus sp. VKM F-4513 (FW-928)]|nr:hypothetical protein V494_02256 [Pseudogymnoascus sp. VKM F-4513 (FW-928)]